MTMMMIIIIITITIIITNSMPQHDQGLFIIEA